MKAKTFELCITFVILLYAFIEGYVDRRRRWKRQTLPSDNVQVHSFDSNVTIEDQVRVTSSNSRIELFESHFGATIWSSSSLLRFNPNDEYVNLTAQKAISKFNLNDAEFITFGQSYSLNETTNRKTDSESQLFLSLQNSVNLSLSDPATLTQVEAINGRKAQINANTWDQQIARKFTISSNVLQNFARELIITSVSTKYNVAIILDGARVALLYGNVRMDIQSDYRKLTLTTETHKVQLQTFESPFDLSITDEELLIRAPNENTALQIKPNSSDIGITVNQLSQMAVDRFGGATLSLQGNSNGSQAEALQLDSQELSLHLFSANESNNNAGIQSTSNHSRLSLQTNLTKASLTAGHHFIQILGGAPHLLLLTGNVTLDVSSNTQGLSAVKLMPEFVAPQDQFNNMGPYGSDTDPTAINTNPGGTANGGTNNNNGSNGPGEGQPGDGSEATVPSVTVKGSEGGNPGDGNPNPGGGSENNPNPGDGSEGNPGFVIVTPTPAGPIVNTPPSDNQNGGGTINSSIDNPILIEPSFPRPITEFPPKNFVIGQFGTDGTAQTPPTIEGFPIFATITNIVLPENSTFADDFPYPPITITTANTTAIFLISTATPLRMLRDDTNAASKRLMEVKLHVQKREIHNEEMVEEIIPDLEKSLSELVENALVNITDEENNSTRKKRMLNEVDVKVYDLIRNEEEPDAIVVKFYVDKPDYFRDLPFLATKLNDFGHQMLSEKLKYKVISPVKVHHNLSLSITLFAILSAFIVMIILIAITIKCTSQKRTWLKYSKRRKVEDSMPQPFTI